MTSANFDDIIPGKPSPRFRLSEMGKDDPIVSSDDPIDILRFQRRADRQYDYWISRKKFDRTGFKEATGNSFLSND